MRETTMNRTTTFLAATLGVAALLAGCSSKSPTAPKPTPIPAFKISLTPETTQATTGDQVIVVAKVTAGSGNAPDGTPVTFDITGGKFSPSGATEVTRTTSGGGASVTITADTPGNATVLGRVTGGSNAVQVTFTGAAPTPTPTGPPDFTPVIYALMPNAGPFEGGTQVVITGTGFQDPVQVLFGARQAQVTSTTYTEIHCVAPSITPDAPKGATTVSVTVVNTLNGKVSPGKDYTYGVTMFISSFTPMEGPADKATTVTVFGQGFVSPVSVVATVAGAPLQWDVLSVAGTELVVSARPLPVDPHACDDQAATFTVTNVDSNQSYTSPAAFTYRGVRPLITSVLTSTGQNTIQQPQCPTSGPWPPTMTVTVHGSGFPLDSNVLVSVSSLGVTLGTAVATVQSANTLTFIMPDLSAMFFQTVPCVVGGGTGRINAPTPLDITVTNTRYGCADTLTGAVIVIPCTNQTCTAPTPTPTPTLPPTPTAPPTFPLTVTKSGNVAGGDITSTPLGLSACTGTTSPCTGSFTSGTLVTLTASAAVTWTGNCTPSGGNPALNATVTMSAAMACNAQFP